MPQITRQMEAVFAAFLEDPQTPLYGLEIGKRAQLASGTFYPLLARMEGAGWLESEWEAIDPVAEGRRPRRYYRLTGEGELVGKRALEQTMTQLRRALPGFGVVS
jgi:PadR family transcriptional regulator PadR